MTSRDIRGATARSGRIQAVRRNIEIGTTGLQVFGGLITGDIAEHNREWEGDNRFKIVDRMRRGDATCAATLQAIVLPIISTDIWVDDRTGKAGEKPPAEVSEAAEFLHWNLFDSMERSWEGWLREAMLYLAYGHYLFEIVYGEADRGQWKGSTIWKKFAPRHPSTVDSWIFNSNGVAMGINQRLYKTDDSPGSFEIVPIRSEKLLMMTNGEEAGNPLGSSIFRPAWKHWKYKDGFYAVQAIAIERQGAGVPYGKYPEGTPDPEIDKLEEMLQNFQAHEQSYATWEEGWEVGFMDMGAAKVLDPADAIEHHDAMIPKSIMAGFLQLTQGDRGSFALSSDSSGFFTYSLQHTANYVANVINRQAIPKLLDANFPDLPYYPKLRFDKVGHISLDRLLDSINKLVSSGALSPGLELENRVREILNLPPIDQEEFDEIKEEKQEILKPDPEASEGSGESETGDEQDDSRE